ncbi:hypothetical protein BpHYR1_014943 [Brachionus plicatilis]|uniref:Uncharacterized protein n=1 Tax=Brachionus plicatilis TaxID=10195 RepID=A0A3M7PUL4_BRAPC|nr:hypothetical protein BpHYR1_014943 [Brachionus plicatilis]
MLFQHWIHFLIQTQKIKPDIITKNSDENKDSTLASIFPLASISFLGKYLKLFLSRILTLILTLKFKQDFFFQYFSMCYVQGATIGDLLVGHLRKLVLLKTTLYEQGYQSVDCLVLYGHKLQLSQSIQESLRCFHLTIISLNSRNVLP